MAGPQFLQLVNFADRTNDWQKLIRRNTVMNLMLVKTIPYNKIIFPTCIKGITVMAITNYINYVADITGLRSKPIFGNSALSYSMNTTE